MNARLVILIISLISVVNTLAQPSLNALWWGRQNTNLTDALVSYWKMDEVSGTRFDSWGTNHLTDVNSTKSTNGLLGNCATNSSNSYLFCADNSGYLKSNFTVSVWYYRTGGTANFSPFGKASDNSINRSFILYGNGSKMSLIYVTNTYSQSRTIDFDNANTLVWKHVAITYDSASSVKVYTNGVLSVSNVVWLPVYSTTGCPICFFTPESGSGWMMTGFIDECAWWNRTLSNTEIGFIYNAGKGRLFPFNSGP